MSNYPKLPEDLWKEIQKDNVQALAAFLETGGDVHALEDEKTNLLSLCLCFSKPSITLLFLLEKGGGVLVNERDAFGSTSLHTAARFGNVGALELLLKDYQGNPNIQNNRGNTPVHEVLNGCPDFSMDRAGVLKMLLSYGGDIFLQNDEGKSAYDLLKERGEKSLLEEVDRFLSEMDSLDIKEPCE